MKPTIEQELAGVERRETHLWLVALLLLLAFVGVAFGSYYTLFEATGGASEQARKVSLRALAALTLLTLVFCGYVLHTRRTFGKIRRLFEAQAIRDSLTGLLNRQGFPERARIEMQRARRDGTLLGFLLCDLDEFKSINDTHGHPEGDHVLRGVAQAVLGATRGTDLVFRWGGDEILVLLSPTVREGLAPLVDRVREGVRGVGEGKNYEVGISLGVSLFPEHGDELEELIGLADRALYIAKKGGSKFHVGEEELPLDESAVGFVFQPVVDSGTRKVMGYEVLSRDPTGKRTVGELFRRYEAVGQLGAFKKMIFENQLKAVAQRGLERVFINVDFSMLDDFEPIDLPPNTEVVLDISESEAVNNIGRYLELIGTWRDKGYKFAIDDFGSSFISLPFVAQLFPSFIKMDRSALLEASGSERFGGFLRDMVAAMRNYSEEGIIAEGVETEEEMRVVRELGVDQVQGHLTGRPESMD